MRDLVVFLLLLVCLYVIFWRPWMGVLALAVFSYMNPHCYCWGPMFAFPTYQLLFLSMAAAFLTERAKQDMQPIPKDWRVAVFYLLWFWYLITTIDSEIPSAAWGRLILISKIYLPLIFTLIYITDKERLRYLIMTIAASFGLLAIKGGVFAITHGFGDRIYGPRGSQFYDNNQFAIAILMNIPLLVLWLRDEKNKFIKLALMAAVPLSFASSLSSWSRGALLTSVMLTFVLLWHSKRKYLVAPLLALGVFVVLPLLPQEWYDRMYTIGTYQEDGSAMGRIRAWADAWEYLKTNPLTGAGFEGWRYVTERDWHNSYVEMAAEHGYVGFLLWFSLIFGTIITLTRLARLGRSRPDLKWVTNYSTMIRASMFAYATGTLFLGLAYWDIVYHLIFITLLLHRFAHQEAAVPLTAEPPPERTATAGGRPPSSQDLPEPEGKTKQRGFGIANIPGSNPTR